MTARQLAYKILRTASSDATYSNIAIDNALKKNSLSDNDAGLVTAIVMGVTERRLTLDYFIDSLAARADKIDAETRILLRMGLFQIYCLDRIPEYAAVNETVSLSPARSRGFVNAILREFLRRREKGAVEAVFPDENDDRVKYLSVKYSFPEEFCKRFIEIYGYERTGRILDIFNCPPRLTLRINTLKISREDYADLLDSKGIEYKLSEDLACGIVLENISFSALPGFDEGYFFIQDEASQICVEAIDAREGQLMIDACSCPGSKSFGSAIRMKNSGEILAYDLHASKLKLIDSGAVRLGIDIIKAEVRDGRDANEDLFGVADRVLCDVPCSGLGVVAKKPEIRYKNFSELTRLPQIQYSILENCSKYVKRGGELVYSTCTVLPEENENNFERFLSEHPEFEALDFSVGTKKSSGGMLSLSPDLDKTDGFFVAKCKRI